MKQVKSEPNQTTSDVHRALNNMFESMPIPRWVNRREMNNFRRIGSLNFYEQHFARMLPDTGRMSHNRLTLQLRLLDWSRVMGEKCIYQVLPYKDCHTHLPRTVSSYSLLPTRNSLILFGGRTVDEDNNEATNKMYLLVSKPEVKPF